MTSCETYPNVSIIVPIFNSERYLDKCLKSIQAQSYKNLEIICVDDGSNDSSSQIVKNVQIRDPRFKYLKQENRGRSAARNLGLEASSSSLIMFVDSDDELPKDSVRNLLGRLMLDNTDAAVGSIQNIYEVHSEIKTSDSLYYTIRSNDVKEMSFQGVMDFYCSACATIFKRQIIESNNIRFPVNLNYEDAYWHWCYFLSCKRVSFLTEPVYLYFRRPGSVMSQTFEKKKGLALQHLAIIERIFEFAFQKHPEFLRSPISKNLLIDYFWLAYKYSDAQDKTTAILKCNDIIRTFGIQDFDDPTIGFIRKKELKKIKLLWAKRELKHRIKQRFPWLVTLRTLYLSR